MYNSSILLNLEPIVITDILYAFDILSKLNLWSNNIFQYSITASCDTSNLHNGLCFLVLCPSSLLIISSGFFLILYGSERFHLAWWCFLWSIDWVSESKLQFVLISILNLSSVFGLSISFTFASSSLYRGSFVPKILSQFQYLFPWSRLLPLYVLVSTNSPIFDNSWQLFSESIRTFLVLPIISLFPIDFSDIITSHFPSSLYTPFNPSLLLMCVVHSPPTDFVFLLEMILLFGKAMLSSCLQLEFQSDLIYLSIFWKTSLFKSKWDHFKLQSWKENPFTWYFRSVW